MKLSHTPQDSILGQATSYPKTYAPAILYPIPRQLGRQKLNLPCHRFIGFDYWHIFELSWLNLQGISQVAMARLSILANSDYIIESKSLKLYLNSLNFSEFKDSQHVQTVIENDLSVCLNSDVTCEIFPIHGNHLAIEMPCGDCIDDCLNNSPQKIALVSDVQAEFLLDTTGNINKDDIKWQHFYSHLLRSNCPVTNQPDWATVEIAIESYPINQANLLKYILSYRNHNGFHEQCVEQIFTDLTQIFEPNNLMVRAFYTRRGGIDINPTRVSDISLLPKPIRLCRQ